MPRHCEVEPSTVALVVDLKPNEPLWPQIAARLRERIEQGVYTPGSRLPSVLALAAEFGVTPITVRKAVAALREAGLIVTHTGMGSYVVESPPDGT